MANREGGEKYHKEVGVSMESVERFGLPAQFAAQLGILRLHFLRLRLCVSNGAVKAEPKSGRRLP
jgi:hypothetical protein